MFRPCVRIAACAVILGLAPAATATAQKLSLSPTIGVYIPTSELVNAANGQEFKQEIALAVGGRLGLNFSPRFGVLTSVTYVPSDLKFDFQGNQTKTNANLLFGTARATLYVLPVTSPIWFSVNGGGSYVRRSGDAYEAETDKDNIGAVVGATVGLRLGSFLSFYVAADDYIYGTRLDAALAGDEQKTQNDIQLAVGFGVPIGNQ